MWDMFPKPKHALKLRECGRKKHRKNCATLNCQVTEIVMNSGYQLSEFQCLKCHNSSGLSLQYGPNGQQI